MMRRALSLSLLLSAVTSGAEIAAVAHPDEEFDAGKTVVWTPLFQAAWDEIHSDVGRPVKVEPPNPLMDHLDRFGWQRDEVMPADGWGVWAGPSTQEFVDEANAAAARLLGTDEGPFEAREPGDSERNLLALGLISRDVRFAKALHLSKNAGLAFKIDGTPKGTFRFFGVRGALSGQMQRTIRVLAFSDAAKAIQIQGQDGEGVVLYLPDEASGFSHVLRSLRAWRSDRLSGTPGSAQDPWLHEDDDLRIPGLRFETMCNFMPRLDGLRYFENRPQPWRIVAADQHLKFELTEEGARLQAKVKVEADPFAGPLEPPKIVPRDFIFDRPFFVFLWRDEADWPYFGAWIGDATALQPFVRE